MKISVRQLNILRTYCLKENMQEEADFCQMLIQECLSNKKDTYDLSTNSGLLDIAEVLERREKFIVLNKRLACVRR